MQAKRQGTYEDLMLRKTFDVYARGQEEINADDFATIIMDDSVTGASKNKGYSR